MSVRRGSSLLLLCIGSTLLVLGSAYAELIEVVTPDYFDTKKMDLPFGVVADIEVHLRSSGDMVNGYRILLIRNTDVKLIKTARTNDHGIVTFHQVPPGMYTVLLRKTKKQKRIGPTVEVGDLVLRRAVEEIKETENEEIETINSPIEEGPK